VGLQHVEYLHRGHSALRTTSVGITIS